jgi:hypothetical protein
MKCPKCHTDNKGGARFCIECGHKFELKCPHCGHSALAAAKFCEECGHQLVLPSKPVFHKLSFDEQMAKIQRYLPRGLTEKILAQRDKIEGERRQIMIVFCDMEGFTPLSQRLGHVEIFALMNQV